MKDYFFPALFIVPDFDTLGVERGDYCIVKRQWDTSTFDLATLATRHGLHLPFQVMDVFLSQCNTEICVKQQLSMENAFRKISSLKFALYANGVSPFITPFATTHSINEYSGINSRDSNSLRSKLPLGLQDGITSESAKVEAWPLELSFQCVVLSEKLNVSSQVFENACESAESWSSMMAKHDTIRGFSDATLSAVMMQSLCQSILHMWCAIESLFPSVGAELSFRVSLYLAQLNSHGGGRRSYFEKVKKGYNTRSKIAHGAKHEATIEEWKAAWEIVTEIFSALVKRGSLPSEDALLGDLLT